MLGFIIFTGFFICCLFWVNYLGLRPYMGAIFSFCGKAILWLLGMSICIVAIIVAIYIANHPAQKTETIYTEGVEAPSSSSTDSNGIVWGDTSNVSNDTTSTTTDYNPNDYDWSKSDEKIQMNPDRYVKDADGNTVDLCDFVADDPKEQPFLDQECKAAK